jgi:tellurite resistance protein TerC
MPPTYLAPRLLLGAFFSSLAGTPIAYWAGFHIVILALIVLDLAILNRGTAPPKTRSNLLFVLFLFALTAVFGAWLGHLRGRQTGLEFATGYLIELALSVDNLFVFLVMFRSFGLGLADQRRALLCGVAGAIVMRGLFIFAGIALLTRIVWIQYLFGALILVAAARLLRPKRTGSPGWMAWLTRRKSGESRQNLLYPVIAIEIVDLIFAVDSIPAVLAVTHNPFVVYTSNIFAIVGLRSLYFLLANLLDRLRFLHVGLAAILGFVGLKMILTRWLHVPIGLSLGFLVLTLVIAMTASLLYPAKQS